MTEIGKYVWSGRFMERFYVIENLIKQTKSDMCGAIDGVPEDILQRMDGMVEELDEIRKKVYQRIAICPSWETMEHTWELVADLEERLKVGPVTVKLEGRQEDKE